jgi:hypothetical protein
MSLKKLKVFETIEKYMKLYEAADDENQQAEPDNAATDAPTDAADATEPQTEGDMPEEQAAPEEGVFMSDNQKAQFAKMMLDALMMTPPDAGTIPNELMNVTTQNADAVIKYIQNLNGLNAATTLDDSSPQSLDNLTGALKDI